MIKVGFIINFKPSMWLGGYNYYKNLFKCLDNFTNKKIIPVIITDKKNELLQDELLSKLEIIETQLVSRSSLLIKILNKIVIIIFNRNFYIDNFLKRNDIKILSHSGWIGKKSEVLNFPWIPDFQELHLPENFSFLDKVIRRVRVFFCTHFSSKILVSSKTVKRDLKSISIQAAKNSILIKHSVDIPSYSELKPFSYLKKKYKINSNYFFLPNHYWKHKNHLVVLKALFENTKKVNFQIISTGNFSDHRHPKYIKKIKDYIFKKKLKNNYRMLNIIPYIDMMSLMHYSIALINPSKSEGWSNTVEQAKAMNKKIILSNIDVHIEQRDKNCIFFNPDDFKKLNKILNKEFIKFKKKKNSFFKRYDNKNKLLKDSFISNYQSSILRLLKKKSIN